LLSQHHQWNPEKELKVGELVGWLDVSDVRWNPEKELKVDPETWEEFLESVRNEVESGEGIERHCAASTRLAST